MEQCYNCHMTNWTQRYLQMLKEVLLNKMELEGICSISFKIKYISASYRLHYTRKHTSLPLKQIHWPEIHSFVSSSSPHESASCLLSYCCVVLSLDSDGSVFTTPLALSFTCRLQNYDATCRLAQEIAENIHERNRQQRTGGNPAKVRGFLH